MLDVCGSLGGQPGRFSRRDVLRAGALGFGGLTLATLLRLQASGTERAGRGKSVIMVWLRGGASHIDSFDMKPAAPPEIRGEFSPIATKVPGIEICEHLPRMAAMMDRLAIVRGIRSNDLGDHTPHYILTGFPDRGKRPVLGAVASYLLPRPPGLPTYVSLMYEPPGLYDTEGPVYLGNAHRPFAPRDEGLENLRLSSELTLDRLGNRHQLLDRLDKLGRTVGRVQDQGAADAFTLQAWEMVTSPRARQAFDLGQEPAGTRERYGKYCENLLMARRLVEAGVSVVTLKLGDWDTHEHNFRDMREQLPQLDQGVHALVSDLYERGLEQDVAVVVWGEFGRAPRISRIAGRDHWPEAGAALLAGGGFRLGQAIGETDSHAGQNKSQPYTPANILATLYRHLGIDPARTLPDFANRPMHVLDDRQPVRELL